MVSRSSSRSGRIRSLALVAASVVGLAGPLVAQNETVDPVDGNIMQYVSNGDAHVSIWLPENWKMHVWNLTLPDGAMSHVMDIESGRSVVVHMRTCSEDRRAAWVNGDEAERELGHRTETIAPADEKTASRFPEAASFVTVATRDDITYNSQAYFLSKYDRCYLVEFVSVVDDFEASLNDFGQVVITFAK